MCVQCLLFNWLSIASNRIQKVGFKLEDRNVYAFVFSSSFSIILFRMQTHYDLVISIWSSPEICISNSVRRLVAPRHITLVFLFCYNWFSCLIGCWNVFLTASQPEWAFAHHLHLRIWFNNPNQHKWQSHFTILLFSVCVSPLFPAHIELPAKLFTYDFNEMEKWSNWFNGKSQCVFRKSVANYHQAIWISQY